MRKAMQTGTNAFQGFRCKPSKRGDNPSTRLSAGKKGKHRAEPPDQQGLGRDRQISDAGPRTEHKPLAGLETAQTNYEERNQLEAPCTIQACSAAVDVTAKGEVGEGQQAVVKLECDAAALMERMSAPMAAAAVSATATDALPAATALSDTAAQAMLDICRKARGKQNICLQNAVGVPERLGDHPLRLIILGNNPSDHAWSTGHYYSHPANWMWRILKQTGIAPEGIRGAQDDARMPSEAGVGFLDVGCGFPGTLLSGFSSATFQAWAPAFYARLAQHAQRAARSAGCGAPAMVAFAGKRQWMELLNVGRRGRDKYTRLEHGLQAIRPQGWPFPDSTEVWVCPSTSGAAPMTTAERFSTWQELGQRLQQLPWPRNLACHE